MKKTKCVQIFTLCLDPLRLKVFVCGGFTATFSSVLFIAIPALYDFACRGGGGRDLTVVLTSLLLREGTVDGFHPTKLNTNRVRLAILTEHTYFRLAREAWQKPTRSESNTPHIYARLCCHRRNLHPLYDWPLMPTLTLPPRRPPFKREYSLLRHVPPNRCRESPYSRHLAHDSHSAHLGGTQDNREHQGLCIG